MDYPEPGSPQGARHLPGQAGGFGSGGYERPSRGEEEEAAEEEEEAAARARPPRRPQPPLRAALSTSSSEGDPEPAAPPRERSLSDEAAAGDFDSAESGASLRYSTGTGGEGSEGEGAGLGSSDSGGSGFSLAATALPERRRPGGGRPRYEVVRELGAEEVRWFYREDRKTWKPFIGYDSLRIELAFRALGGGGGGGEPAAVEPVCVRSGLYEVDVASAESYPVYWNRECRRAGRGGGGRVVVVPRGPREGVWASPVSAEPALGDPAAGTPGDTPGDTPGGLWCPGRARCLCVPV